MTSAAGSRTGLSRRKALVVDQKIKEANGKRLRRIEGQVRGLHKMVHEDRYCADILIQIGAVQQALRAVAKALMRNHLRNCVSQTLQRGSRAEREKMYDEILGLIDLHAQ
jgi:DNA-binding FrmR family transcriptional regulator